MNGLPAGLFAGEKHEPFYFQGAQTAALLVHGFPGTPAEMRPLGALLHESGWTAEGLLLPGFGAQIATLFEHKAGDWVAAVQQAVRGLRRQHEQVVLVAYSFGAMVSLNAILQEPVERLVLIAPFWKLGGLRERLIWTVMKRFSPEFKPFRRLDFSSQDVRQGIGKMLPGIDLAEPEMQAALRSLSVPADFIDQIGRLGRQAHSAAGQVEAPTLVIQGQQDDVARPEYTAELCRAFPQPPETLNLPAGHDLLASDSPVLPSITRAVLSLEAARQQA